MALGFGVGFDKNIDGVINDMQNAIDVGMDKISSNFGLNNDLISLDSKLNSTGAKVNNVSIVVNPQQLNEQSLDQAFNYVNRRFGLAL